MQDWMDDDSPTYYGEYTRYDTSMKRWVYLTLFSAIVLLSIATYGVISALSTWLGA